MKGDLPSPCLGAFPLRTLILLLQSAVSSVHQGLGWASQTHLSTQFLILKGSFSLSSSGHIFAGGDSCNR